MKVLSHRVDKHEGWANRPSIHLTVDKMPDMADFRYEERDGLFFAELDGVVSYYAYRGPGAGYGGRTFTITMTDGTTRDLIGPWSGNSGAMTEAGFTPSQEVVIHERDGKYPDLGFASAVTAEFLKAILPLIEVTNGGSRGWEPCDENGRPLKPFDHYTKSAETAAA